MLVPGAQVLGAGADQAVVGQLLANMGGPAGDAAAGEDGREDVRRDSQIVVG